jgi:hypothetical protein
MRRDYATDLLTRPPCGVHPHGDGWIAFLIDPTEQLMSLADLLARGLLSPEEYAREKAKIIEL